MNRVKAVLLRWLLAMEDRRSRQEMSEFLKRLSDRYERAGRQK